MECLERRVALARQPVLTRKQFLESYSSPACSLHAADILSHYGIFDAYTQAGEECITYGSRQLPALTLLGAYTHFAGSLGVTHFNEDNRPSRFVASLGKGRDAQPALFDYFYEQLGLTFLGEEKKNVFSRHGSIYARLLYLLSFSTSLTPDAEHRNTKAERGALLPQYLTRLVDEYPSFGVHSKHLALRYLRDILAVFADTCASTTIADSSIRLNLPSRRKEESLRKEAGFLMSCFSLAYPSLHLSESHPHIFSRTVHGKIRYEGYFALKAPQIYEASLSNPLFPARIRVFPKPYFSFQYR